MAKSMKKYFLLALAAVLAVTLAACSKAASADDIINKSTEVSKSLKSTDFKAVNSSEITTNNETQKVENTVSGTIFIDPFSMHVTTEIASGDQSQSLELYIKDGVAYANTTGQDAWVKSSNSAITEQFQNLKKIANSDQILDFYKKIAKDFKVTEENGNYVLTYSGSGDQFKELMVAVTNATSGSEVSADAFNNVDFKSVNIKYVVDKDFNPVSNETVMELATKNTDTPTTMKMTQNISYSNVNKAAEITLPDNVKNAEEVGANTDSQQ